MHPEIENEGITIDLHSNQISRAFAIDSLFFRFGFLLSSTHVLLCCHSLSLSANCAFLMMIMCTAQSAPYCNGMLVLSQVRTDDCVSQFSSHSFLFSSRLVSVVVFGYADYYLKISSTAPAIEGVNVTIYADLYVKDGKRPPNETFLWVSGNFSAFYLLALRSSDG